MQVQKPAYHSVLPFLICGLAALFYVYDYFIQVAPSVITFQLMRSFSIDAAGLGVLGASFFYAYTLMQIPSGLLLDRFGARRILSAAVFVSASGVAIFGITEHFFLAAFARFLIGLGSACAFISVVFLIANWLPHRYFAVSVGFVQLMACVGSVFGEAPLAITVNHFGWRHVMIITGLVTFILSIIYWMLIRDGKQQVQQFSGQKSLLRNEWQRLTYLVRERRISWVALCGLVCWVPVGIVGALWGVPYLMKVYHWNNVFAGKICALFWLGIGIGSPFVGWYSNRIGSRKKPFIICFSLGLIAALLIVAAPYLPAWIIGIALFLLGISASVQALSFSVIKDIVPSSVFGTASGLVNMAAIVGGGMGQMLVGILLRFEWNGVRLGSVPIYSVQDYQFGLTLLIVAAVIGLLTSCFKMTETYKKN